MRLITLCFIVILFAALLFSCDDDPVAPQDNSDRNVDPIPDTTSVLFIGSSYTLYNNMPRYFRLLAEAGGKPAIVGSALQSGTGLGALLTMRKVRDKVMERAWDYVVLQGSPQTLAYPETVPSRGPLIDTIVAFRKFIRDSCSVNAIPVYFMPWAYGDGMAWHPNYTHNYGRMQTEIYNHTIILKDALHLMVAPVGEAWRDVIKEKRTENKLFQGDQSHPTRQGSYLSACVFYCTLFQDTLSINSFEDGLLSEAAQYYQDKADNQVLPNLEFYNIIPPNRD